jgi:GNAT superfamily N-acetyltransferase
MEAAWPEIIMKNAMLFVLCGAALLMTGCSPLRKTPWGGEIAYQLGALQGKGHGARLLQELELRAAQSGIRTLSLETARRRPLTLEFYRKHGYHETGRGLYGAVETVQFSKRMDG